MEEAMTWLKDFVFSFVGRAIVVMLLVAITGLIIWYIGKKIKIIK